MSKLYTVTAEFQYVIVAENMEQARRFAYRTAQEAIGDQAPDDIYWIIQEGIHAEGWDERSYPYGDCFERTVGEYLEEQT